MENTIRRRPLHTCGIAALTMAHIICARALEIDGPLGSLTRTLKNRGTFLKPTIHTLLCLSLALLSFIDDQLLALMIIITSRFPSSYRVFNQIDKAVFLVEKLPGKLDDLLNKFPLMLHRAPLLEQLVYCAIYWMNSMIVMLTMGAFKNAEEKEIGIDSYCMEENEELSLADDKKYVRRRGEFASQDRGRKEQETEAEESLDMVDPILQLFEEGWQAPRTGGSFMLSSNSNL